MKRFPGEPAAREVGGAKAVLLQNTFGKIPSQTDLTMTDDQLALVELAQTRAKLTERNIQRAGNRAQLVFDRFSNVKDDRVFGNRVGIDDVG